MRAACLSRVADPFHVLTDSAESEYCGNSVYDVKSSSNVFFSFFWVHGVARASRGLAGLGFHVTVFRSLTSSTLGTMPSVSLAGR